MKPAKREDELKPLSSVIQICPKCGKVDAYKGDKHNCLNEIRRKENEEHYD
jgi:hypothetical protein